MSSPTLQPFDVRGGTSSGRVECAALSQDYALLADGRGVTLIRSAGEHVRDLSSDMAATSLSISPSERFLLVCDSRRARVWDRDRWEPVLDLPVDAATTMGATFGRLDVGEILLQEPAQAKLDAYALPSGTRIFQGSTETFLIEWGAPLADAMHIVVVGHFRGEGKHSLSVVPVAEITQPAELLFARFRQKRPISDYAYRLAAGPCGTDGLVVFRDPEDDEDPDDDDDESALDTSGTAMSTADVRGHRGFYARKIDGTLIAKLAWDGPIKSFARLAATRSWIAAECGDQLALVPFRVSEGTERLERARWLAVSPDGGRVLVEMADRSLGIVHLPK